MLPVHVGVTKNNKFHLVPHFSSHFPFLPYIFTFLGVFAGGAGAGAGATICVSEERPI